MSVYNGTNSTQPCLLSWVPLFALSISKPPQNAGHKYSCTAQGANGSFGVAPFLPARHPPPLSNPSTFSRPVLLYVLLQHLSAPLSSPEDKSTHAHMLLRPFQWCSPNGAGAFVPCVFLTRFGGSQQGSIRLPIEGGVALAAGRV